MVEMQRAKKLDEFRQQQFNTDIVLECKGGIIHAHKLILMSSCTYFDKMFTAKMLEENSGQVNLTNFSKEAIDVVVKYLYTTELPHVKNYNTLKELIETCHMMEIKNLLKHCWKEITHHHLNMETFDELWVIAVTFELRKNSTIVDFIRDHLKEIILESETLQNFTEREMAQLFKCIDQRKFCNECVQCLFKWNSNGEKDEAAANLLDKLDLKYLDDASFHNLLRMSLRNEEKKSIKSVVIGQTLNRLPKRFDAFKTILNNVIEICNVSTYHDKKVCIAKNALRTIKKDCKEFCHNNSVSIFTDLYLEEFNNILDLSEDEFDDCFNILEE